VSVLPRPSLIAAAILTVVTGCAAATTADRQPAGSAAPGWTGRTQVVGNNSTVAGNDEATYLQQKWGVGNRR
jgi:hypothetical protein